MIAATPQPPYYAVIFTATMSDDGAGYAAMAEAMSELAARQPGYLGKESAVEGAEITVSYWRDLASIAAWKAVVEHETAQRLGRGRWYSAYRVRVARVDRDYGFDAPASPDPSTS